VVCASAPVTEATAIRPATAVTFLPVAPSAFSSNELIVANDRSDRGATAYPMSNKPQAVNFLVCSFLSSTSVDQLVSGVKIQVNAARPADALECVQIKAILKAELESF
jgi:hypothetical protein